MIFVLTCIRTQIGFRQLSLRQPDMYPIIIWTGCFIASMLGVVAGELITLWNTKRWARSVFQGFKR